MTISAATPKDIQKLQRLIVDALEDVKAQDIVVFNTEHLSPLFERVIIATGTSNRQTKSLASSVRDKVREAGLPKPRLEGEDNGEWIIVDCGPAVVHIMQQAIRQYYHLEEIWGDKPVRLKLGAPKPLGAAAPAKTQAAKDKPKGTSSKSSTSKSAPAPSAPSKTAARAKTSRAPAKAKSPAVSAKPTTPAKSSKTTGRSKTKAA
jgi:ribosome-associated protein